MKQKQRTDEQHWNTPKNELLKLIFWVFYLNGLCTQAVMNTWKKGTHQRNLINLTEKEKKLLKNNLGSSLCFFRCLAGWREPRKFAKIVSIYRANKSVVNAGQKHRRELVFILNCSGNILLWNKIYLK